MRNLLAQNIQMRSISTLLIVALQVPAMSWAAISPLYIKPGSIGPSLASGALTGGAANDEFTLVGVQAQKVAGGSERLVIKYGDRLGRPSANEVGYFHINVDRGGRRVSIDLAQVQRTAIDPKQLAKILAPLKLISSSEMTMDPQDHSTNITLQLKMPVVLKVASGPTGQGGRLVLEMRRLANPSKGVRQ